MLKTPPNTGTYYPPKIMCDGQWRYMVGVTEWHDHENDAREAHRYRDALQRIADYDPDDETGLIDCIDIATSALQ